MTRTRQILWVLGAGAALATAAAALAQTQQNRSLRTVYVAMILGACADASSFEKAPSVILARS